jgi:hypothetical protein
LRERAQTAERVRCAEVSRKMRDMRTNLFIKVVVEHDAKEQPEKLGAELCRQLEKNYVVRNAELSSFAAAED